MRVPLRPRDICALLVVGAFALAASGTHVVRSGETLSSIAQRNGTTVQALVEANGIANPDRIVAGARLSIPGGGTPSSTPGGPQLAGQRHTVQRGDTIAGIAARYGIRTADLVAWNGLVDGKLYATTRLVLFDPGSLPAIGGTTSTPGGTHVVQPGQSLSAIAGRYGVSATSIAQANGVSDPNRIRSGQTLTIPGGSGGGARFVCPVPGGTFFNDWGFPRSGGRAHAGTDLFAPRGTPVRAPVSGRVEIANGTIGGKQFRLTTPDGVLYFGSHLDAFGASGQVRAGDVIGYVGDSGNARGSRPHLHFEVHPSGSAVNPFPLLRSTC